jgi:hypothetical protein
LDNPSEKVVGYFGVANIQKKKIWIDRKETSKEFEFILGYEPMTIKTPLAVCIKGPTKTPIKPEGWIN